MNILDNLNFNQEKPATFSIRKSENINVFAVGLLKSQILKKHTTSIPTMLTVLEGEIAFYMHNEIHNLVRYDTFQIPMNVEHQVEGLTEKNVFTLTQEK